MTVQEAFNLATQHHQAGRFAEAEGIYRQIVAQQPAYAGAWNRLGQLAMQVRRPETAVEMFTHSVAAEPANPEWRFNLAAALAALNRLPQAIATYRQCLDLDPNSVAALSNLGICVQRAGNVKEAITHYRRAIELQSNYADAYNNLGSALRQSDDLEGSIAVYRKAIQLRPDDVAAHNNLANVLYAIGDLQGALASCRRGIAIRPDFAQGHWTHGLLLLVQEDFARGWDEYEWRLKMPRPMCYDFPQPIWTGGELPGGHIFLHAEQGFGDTLQFIRYLPLVAQRVPNITLACQPELMSLISQRPEIQRLIPLGQQPGNFDTQCPLPSLAWALKTTPATIPNNVPYLSATDAMQSQWRDRLSGDNRFKIGLAWRGRPNPDPKRTIPSALLAPLAAVPNVHLISLQKGDIDPSPPFTLTDWTAQLNDFADTAGLIAQLDLVVSIDSAVAHLAGAMGKPTWTMLPFAPDFRWRLNCSDNPWYPSMRLFRQKRPNDWPAVVQEVVQALNVR